MSRFRDAPNNCRCQAVIRLKDKSTAQCGRYRKFGVLCTQHARKADVETLRRYHIVAISEDNGAWTRMSAYPLTHAEACTNLGKLTAHKSRRLMLVEAQS